MDRLVEQIKRHPSPYVLMAVGIPGSGKTTLLTKVAATLDIERISPDDIREALAGDAADQSVNTRAWEEAYKRAEHLLHIGKSIIIDATHAEAWRRPGAINQYRSFGAKSVIALVFDVPLSVAQARNAARERVVPDHALKRMHASLQEKPVAISEGFDNIIAIE